MTKQIQFVSVDEKALETVAGGLLDIGNGSANYNNIAALSNIQVGVLVGDVASFIGNVLNQVG